MDERWAVQVGKKIRELRQAHDMTQQELGQQMGISRQSISELEQGKTGLTFDRVERVLDTFGYELELFIVQKDESD